MSDTKPISLKTDKGRRTNSELSYAQNIVKYRDKSNLIQNEAGNEYKYEVPIGYVPIGTINIDRHRVVLFSATPTKTNTFSEIGMYDRRTNVYTTLINSSCLNFDTDWPIKGISEIRNGCEQIIIFYDYNNPDKLINLDSLDSYKTDDEWDCNKMKLDRDYQVPIIDNLIISEGGGTIEIGSYAFSIELLDDSLNPIYISDTSASIPIIYDSIYSSYNSIFGAKNIENTVAEDGGKPEANKSIQININNLDTSFSYFRLIVARRTTGNGETIEYLRDINLYPITKSDYTHIFRGVTTSFEQIDSFELITKPVRYSSSRHIEKIDKKLVRFNLKGETRDWASIQQLVNNITIGWTNKQVNANDQTTKGNPKNPNTYFDTRTFIGDEIYAPGISFLFETGEESPIFPIPGRVADSYDLQELTVVNSNPGTNEILFSEVEHLGLIAGDTIPRWKAINTYKLHGVTGYFQTDNDYPSVRDCDGNRIYPEGKVRLIRMPDRRRVPVFQPDGNNINLNILGLNFGNIVYPEGAIAHKFHMAKRTDENKTVLDMGIIFDTRNPDFSEYSNAEYHFDFFRPTDKLQQEAFGFISPKVLAGEFLNGSHISFTKVYNRTGAGIIFGKDYELSGGSGKIEVRSFINTYTNNGYPEFNNITFDSPILIAPNSQQSNIGNFAKGIVNNSFSNNILVQRFKRTNNRQYGKLYSVNYKSSIVPYNSFESLEYIPISKYLTLSDSQLIYGGDAFISKFSVFNLWELGYDTNSILGLIDLGTDYNAYADYETNIWIESEINYELIVRGTDCNDKYIYTGDYTDDSIQNYTITRVADFNSEDGEWLIKSPCQEYYNYNLDYNFYHHGRSNFILPITFNYCSKCSNLFPNRFIWSQDSLSEELENGWLVFLNENYGIVGENTGQITSAHFDKNRLLVRTERSRFALTPNPQYLRTDEGVAFMGSGDFLSIPASQLVKTNYGYAGGQGFLDEINTHYGLISVDVEGRAIYMFSDNGIINIASEEFGNYEFFQDYLDVTDSYNAVQLVYDPNYERLIVNHKINNWVLSFDLKDKIWKSFHTYKNQFIFNDGYDLYSSDSYKVYKHLTDSNYNVFYEEQQDTIVEIQPFGYDTKDLHSLVFYTQTFDGERQLRYPSFTKAWVYTNKQSTGIFSLVPKDFYRTWSNVSKPIIEAKKNYKINKIRDISITDLPTYEGRPDQKVPININNLMPQQFQSYMNDKYFNIRFFFKSENNHLILIDVIKTMESNSFL